MINIKKLDNGQYASMDENGEIEIIRDTIDELLEYFGLGRFEI